jgi:hypothetical protein
VITKRHLLDALRADPLLAGEAEPGHDGLGRSIRNLPDDADVSATVQRRIQQFRHWAELNRQDARDHDATADGLAALASRLESPPTG